MAVGYKYFNTYNGEEEDTAAARAARNSLLPPEYMQTYGENAPQRQLQLPSLTGSSGSRMPPGYEGAGELLGSLGRTLGTGSKTPYVAPFQSGKQTAPTVDVNPNTGGGGKPQVSGTGGFQKYFDATQENRLRVISNRGDTEGILKAMNDMATLKQAYDRDTELSGTNEAPNPIKEALTGTYESDYNLAKALLEEAIKAKAGGGGPQWRPGEYQMEQDRLELDRQREANALKKAYADIESQKANLMGNMGTSILSSIGQAAPNAMMPGQQYGLGFEPGGAYSALANMGGFNPDAGRIQGVNFNPNLAYNGVNEQFATALARLGQ